MPKPELSPVPVIHIRYCPINLLGLAGEVAIYGYNHYPEWPNDDCIITSGGYVWYWRCSRNGNVTVFYEGPDPVINEVTDE